MVNCRKILEPSMVRFVDDILEKNAEKKASPRIISLQVLSSLKTFEYKFVLNFPQPLSLRFSL